MKPFFAQSEWSSILSFAMACERYIFEIFTAVLRRDLEPCLTLVCYSAPKVRSASSVYSTANRDRQPLPSLAHYPCTSLCSQLLQICGPIVTDISGLTDALGCTPASIGACQLRPTVWTALCLCVTACSRLRTAPAHAPIDGRGGAGASVGASPVPLPSTCCVRARIGRPGVGRIDNPRSPSQAARALAGRTGAVSSVASSEAASNPRSGRTRAGRADARQLKHVACNGLRL